MILHRSERVPASADGAAGPTATRLPIRRVTAVMLLASDGTCLRSVPESAGYRGQHFGDRPWFKATREGVYYGQCSELCGRNHAFMPIAVRVMSEQDFNAWVDAANKRPDWKTAGAERAVPSALAQVEDKSLR